MDVTQILSTLGSAATGLPSVLLTLAFILLGTYFMSGEQSKISGFLAQCLGEKGTQLGHQLRAFLYESVGKWLRAQCILICITFCELSVGFFLLKLPYAGLLALLIAFIDALPILGAGAVLLPWALFSFLLGQKGLALGLGLLYAVMLLVRSLLEPRIVGAQLGLDPFVTLLCIYFGFRIAGFAGMFILPVVVLTTFKLREWGYVSLEKTLALPREKNKESPFRPGDTGPVVTCAFCRWVRSSLFQRFQLPTLRRGREACNPQRNTRSRFVTLWVKIDPAPPARKGRQTL